MRPIIGFFVVVVGIIGKETNILPPWNFLARSKQDGLLLVGTLIIPETKAKFGLEIQNPDSLV